MDPRNSTRTTGRSPLKAEAFSHKGVRGRVREGKKKHLTCNLELNPYAAPWCLKSGSRFWGLGFKVRYSSAFYILYQIEISSPGIGSQ